MRRMGRIAKPVSPSIGGEPHDLQRFAVGRLGGTGGGSSLPGRAVREQVDRACTANFERFVGVAATASSLSIAVTRPSIASWEAGDRHYQCLLGVPGHHLIGDAEGVGA